MGNQLSAGKSSPPQGLKALTDARYGGVVAINTPRTKVYQTFDVDGASTEEFKDSIRERKILSHPGLVTVGRYWLEDYRENCSLIRRNKVTVEYTYIEKCLEDLVMGYCEKNMPFPEPQLRAIFFDVVSCLLYLKENGTCHGDVKPKNILCGANGRAFMTDSYFMNQGKIAFEIVMEDPESLSLLSPEQLANLRDKQFGSLKNIHKDEMFGVGLTMMEAMTADPAMECYDLANLRIKPNYFPRKYEEIRSYGYSAQIASLVMECVDISEKRP